MTIINVIALMKKNESDPFLGYCKQHSDSSVIKSRKTNYLAMISDFKSKSQASNCSRVFLKNESRVKNYDFQELFAMGFRPYYCQLSGYDRKTGDVTEISLLELKSWKILKKYLFEKKF